MQTMVNDEQPCQYERRVLLAVTGLSPQVVTESLYALARRHTPPWLPTEIRLVTTADGAERARLQLLSAAPGWFHALRRDYRLPAMHFDEQCIDVIPDAGGLPLDDIRTVADNQRAADFITERVRALTADPDSSLHVSIAGGRKTMGFYAGYALSLFGRAQDRLSHVLVSAPFESHPEFFYPTPHSRVIYGPPPGGRPLDTATAEVVLAPIPFVRLRDGLPGRLRAGESRYSEVVAAAQRATRKPELLLDLASGRVRANGEAVPMRPADAAFLALAARRVGAIPAGIHWRDDDLPSAYLAEYARITGPHSGPYCRAEQALLGAQHTLKAWFDQRKSRTNRHLRDALGESLARVFQVQPVAGRRPLTRFGLALPPAAIHFHTLPEEPGL